MSTATNENMHRRENMKNDEIRLTKAQSDYEEQLALRQSSLINRAEVRRKLIMQAQDIRYYWKQFQPRVSKATLDKIEANVSAHIRSIVEKLPSKGKTI